jgi:hypothetical protein
MHAGMRYPKRGTDTGGQTRRRRQYTTASVRARRLWMSAAGPARLPLYGWPAPRGTLPFACKARARGTRRRKRGCARTGTAAGRIVAALGAARGRADPAGAADRILLPNLPRDRGGDRRKRGTRRPRHPCQMQHGPVADAIARGGIRSVEHRLHLVPQKIRDQMPIRLLERDGEDAADMLQGCRLPVFEEVEEGLDGRQPDIACHRRVFALILKIFQKGTDEATDAGGASPPVRYLPCRSACRRSL